MCCGDIDFSNSRVPADHFQCAMPEDGLQCEDVAATPQVSDGERVAETVWEAVLYSSSRRDGFDQEPQGIPRQRPHPSACEEGGLRIVAIRSLGEVPPDGPSWVRAGPDPRCTGGAGIRFSATPSIRGSPRA